MTLTFWRQLLPLLALPVAVACGRAAYRYQPLPTATEPTAAAPQLLFVSFRMAAPATGPHRLELIQAQAVPGEMNALATTEEIGSAYLLLTQLDAQGRPCGAPTKAPHPLFREVEAPGVGATMMRKTVTLPEAEFFVRLARQAQARSLRVEEQGSEISAPISVSFPLTL